MCDYQNYETVHKLFNCNHIERVKQLFPNIIDPNAQLSRKAEEKIMSISPLCLAIELTNDIDLDTVQYLIQIGAEVNNSMVTSTSPEADIVTTQTALSYALRLRKMNCIRVLLMNGAAAKPLAPLVKLACFHVDIGLVKLIDLKTQEGSGLVETSCFPLHWVLPSGYLTQRSELDLQKINDISLIKNAMKNPLTDEEDLVYAQEHLDFVRYLLENGCSPNTPHQPSGLTPGMLVSRGDKLGIYKLLILHGLNVNATCSKGKSVLYYAIRSNDINVIKFLIQSGASISCMTKESGGAIVDALVPYLPLHTFHLPHKLIELSSGPVDHNTCKIVEFLTATGVNVDTRDLADRLLATCPLHRTLYWILNRDGAFLPTSWIDKRVTNEDEEYTSILRIIAGSDCITAAGYQTDGVLLCQLHLSSIMNDLNLYTSVKYANPYVIYKFDTETMSNINKGADRQRVMLAAFGRGFSPSNNDILNPDSKVHSQLLRDRKYTPTLEQIATASIRKHLLRVSRYKKSLFPIVRKIPGLAQRLRDVITLHSFVSYDIPFIFRRKMFDN